MGGTVAVVAAIWASATICTGASAKERMVVERNILTYDLSDSSGLPDAEQTILPNDHLLLAELLMENPSVDTIIVSGNGGLSGPAYAMATKIEGFGLNTIARDTCVSACAIILLGGKERTIQQGARLGFHRISNSANYLRDSYSSLKDEKGWKEEFGFAAHVFEQGEIAARNYINFFVSRGVSVSFALRALTYDSTDMWYPTEKELLESGVLTSSANAMREVSDTP
jgi:hypothetical protein